MSLHISATTGCNLGCSYCYENPDRERKQEWVDRQYDLEKIFERMEDWKDMYPGQRPGMHGGEPLLVRNEDLWKIFEKIDELWGEDGTSHIQTNATLLEDEHIEMFREHNVYAGVSCDGPVELNRLRKTAGERDGDETAATDKMSQKTLDNIDKLAKADGVDCGIITVLNEQNAGTEEKFEILLDWIDGLNQEGVTGHFNPAIPYEEVSPDEDVALGREALKDRYLRAWEWMKEEEYRSWGPINVFVDNLLGADLTNCTNNKCDVGNAGAAKIIMGDGETTGCGKTWAQYGDGGAFLQGDSTDNKYDDSDERYEILKQTPGWVTEDEPDMGGCKGCRYWNVCQGGCPGAGMDDDYRTRTHFCKAKHALYSKIEEDLRAILPNINLITDLPWNSNISDYATNWDADIKPFAAMRPGVEGRSSSTRGYNHDLGRVEQRVPDDVLPDKTFDECVEDVKEEYPEEHLTIDRENKGWHADSAMEDQ